MNRLVIIGNGFDLAHGLKTSYKDFIEWYWKQRLDGLLRERDINSTDCLCTFILKAPNYKSWHEILKIGGLRNFDGTWHYSTKDIIKKITDNKEYFDVRYSPFYENITKSIETKGWVDIENEYYLLLKNKYNTINFCKELNNQLIFLQNKLVEYLKTQNDAKINNDIFKLIYDVFDWSDFCAGAEISESKDPEQVLILSFNYTNTAKLYDNRPISTICNIHGSLDKPEEIIFGYGDELDKNYQDIRDMNDNELLKNMKNVKYLEADNYKRMLRFIEAKPFQVYIMGHSCGNSDRTLLNTIFEHKNCVSIKPFFRKRENGTDNYLDIVQNISRNFTDMKLYRDKVVNKTLCIPLPQP